MPQCLSLAFAGGDGGKPKPNALGDDDAELAILSCRSGRHGKAGKRRICLEGLDTEALPFGIDEAGRAHLSLHVTAAHRIVSAHDLADALRPT